MHRTGRFIALAIVASSFASLSATGWTQTTEGANATPPIAVAPQYDTPHVYVAPADVGAFVASFLGTFSAKARNR
jgi:hypothetical protein